MKVRIYTRRSKNDEGKQQFSLDVQRHGCDEMVDRLTLGDAERAEYVDDGRAGDDFMTRAGLRQLITEASRGDVIVCRDQSRLGRDAIEVTLVVRELVRDRGCRLYYYATGQEVFFANAIDQATTFIQGTGHQMELEAIRSRTREALRSRARDGRIAGGACFGYCLERRSDGAGRKYTVATVNAREASVVRRIFSDYLEGRGLKAITHALNVEGVPAPSAGRRGTGSWAPSAVRTILLNTRYRGLYVHGRIKKVRQGGATLRVKADPSDVITTEVPEWRIVDDETWLAVHDRFSSRGPNATGTREARYALTGIAKCAACGGSVISMRNRGNVSDPARRMVYACSHHHYRGAAACPVTVYQCTQDVEAALVEVLQSQVLREGVVQDVVAQVRAELTAQSPAVGVEIAEIEASLRETRTQQKRLAKALALVDDVQELASEIKERAARIQHLEARLLSARRTPDQSARLLARVESVTRTKLADLRGSLSQPEDLRAVFLALFPDGLKFTPARSAGGRQVWHVEGVADLTVEDVEVAPISAQASDIARACRVATPTGFEPVLPA